jgi:DtxR family Mn-dependent transcriptional regulator
MERDGLLHVSGDRHLELTEDGRAKATRVMRKHRLAERLLLDVIGLEWEFVHEEACRWEHVMSDRVERKLLAMLDDPRESPYGNPIPGLAEIGGTAAGDFRTGVVALPAALDAQDRVGAFVVRRLGEPLQSDPELMGRLSRAGVRPGAQVSASREGVTVRVHAEGEALVLPLSVAAHVFVAAPAPAVVTAG